MSNNDLQQIRNSSASYYIYGSYTLRHVSGSSRVWCERLKVITLPRHLVVNLFLHNSMLDLMLSYAGVVIFVGLTAWDSQKIKQMLAMQTDMGETAQKMALTRDCLSS